MIYLYLVLCNILFIPYMLCTKDVPLQSKSDITNHSLLDSPLVKATKQPLESEGGPMPPDSSDLALPKENHDIPSLGNEIAKSKTVARKGAFLTDDNNVTKSQEDIPLSSEKNTTAQPSISGEKPKTVIEQQQNTTNNINVQHDNSTLLNNTSEKASNITKEVPKKPLTLNAEKLESYLPEVEPSHDTLVKNQIQSPKEKTYLSNANSHPGMVMPIVITILLVPMFAVLGYMALRRGQEAWKNRHYKRMDFLLDGMYND